MTSDSYRPTPGVPYCVNQRVEIATWLKRPENPILLPSC